MSFAGLTDKDREGLNTLEAKQRGFDCGVGSYCGDQIGTTVGTGSAARTIFHRTSTTISNNKATTDVYILSDGNWVKAATTTDGGKTYSYNEETRPDGSKIVGTGVRQSLASGGNMNSNVKAQVTRTLQKGGANLTGEPKLTNNQIQEVGAVASNNATTNQGEDTAAAERDIGTQRGGTRDSFRKDLVYPITLRQGYQDRIQFNMIKYRPRPFTTGSNLNPVGNRPEGDIIGTVTLPIPSGISDAKTTNWSQDELTPVQSMLAELATAGVTQGPGAMADVASNQVGAISANSGDAATALGTKFIEAATGTQNLLSRTRGLIINPNMELLFTGPQLRPFNFVFKFSARSKKEAEMIRDIIRFFKQGMSPIRTEGNLFLKAPHTFQIKYWHRNEEHKYLNKFKEAALTAFNVDYTPEGQYATFTDGAMVSYQVNMQFQELEPVFNDEYGLTDGTIGY